MGAPTRTIQSVIAGECGVVDCGDLVDWARMRATEAARRGGAAAWRIPPRTARRREISGWVLAGERRADRRRHSAALCWT